MHKTTSNFWVITKKVSSVPLYVKKHGGKIVLTPGTDSHIEKFTTKELAEKFMWKFKLSPNVYHVTDGIKVFEDPEPILA